MGPVGRGYLPCRGTAFPLVHLVLPVLHTLVGPAIEGVEVFIFGRQLVVGHRTVRRITAHPDVKTFWT